MFILTFAEEKTQVVFFGRFATEQRTQCGKGPKTFVFLGLKHVCGVDRGGKFAVVRIPSVKSCGTCLARTHEGWVRHMHWKRRDQQRHLHVMLTGFYQYLGLHHCQRKLQWVMREVQRHRLYWSYLASRSWFELPYPKTVRATV